MVNHSGVVLLLILSSMLCFGQEPPTAAAPVAEKPDIGPTTILRVESTVDVPSVADPFIVTPVVCGVDGAIFVRMARSNVVGNLIAISSDGKGITSFEPSKITDITNPKAERFFVRDSDVYILVHGSGPESKPITLRRPDGSIEHQMAPTSPPQYFIARFKSDGAYLGAVLLDIPFTPAQVGAFPSGDFLVAGSTKNMREARVALVKSNGQFNRFVELKNDIHLQSESNGSTETSSAALPTTGKRFGEGFFEAIQISTIVADGRNLLLIRTGQHSPVFSVSPGGEVEDIWLKVPEGYRLRDIKTTPYFWVASFMHRLSEEGAGVEFSSMAIDPKTGKALEVYAYNTFPGFGFACTDGLEFSFLVRDDNKLKILKLISSHRSSSEK
jgi:hypothetical protein